MKQLSILLLAAGLLAGCAGGPFETSGHAGQGDFGRDTNSLYNPANPYPYYGA